MSAALTEVTTCPAWCTREHGPGETYHASASASVLRLEGTFDVHLSYDPDTDPGVLVEMGGTYTELLTLGDAQQLATALLDMVETAGPRAVQ